VGRDQLRSAVRARSATTASVPEAPASRRPAAVPAARVLSRRAATNEETALLRRLGELEDHQADRWAKLWTVAKVWYSVFSFAGPVGRARTAKANRVALADAIERAEEGEPVVNAGTGTEFYWTPEGKLLAELPTVPQYMTAREVRAARARAVLGAMQFSPLSAIFYLGADAAGWSQENKETAALVGAPLWEVAMAASGVASHRQANAGAGRATFGPVEPMQHGAPLEPRDQGMSSFREAVRARGAEVLALSERPSGRQPPGPALDYVTNRERGPVITGVLDLRTGQISYGINQGLTPAGSVMEGIHPVMKQFVSAYNTKTAGTTEARWGTPGSHAEVTALSNALYAREAALKRSATSADLSEMVLHNMSLQTNPHGTGVPPLCPNCSNIVPPNVMILP